MVAEGTPWYRGKEITSGDLLLTESHLVARWDFGSERPSMVERFRLDGSVLFHMEEDGRLLIGASDLEGVTDRGHPVALAEGEYLELTLPAEYRGRSFELSILCNPDRGEAPVGEDLPKFVLSVEPEEPPPSGGRLSLGRWVVNADAELEMEALPLPARMGSLMPHDSWWEQWASPFRKALAEHLALGRIGPEADWKQLLWIQELADLASEWIRMPVAEVAARCRFARWLADGADLGAGVEFAPAGPGLPTDSGQDLPRALVDLLGRPVRTSAPAAARPRQSDPLPTALAVALRFMAPETLLARFPEDAAREMSLCVALSCRPPARLQVRAGAGAQGFRVSGEISGEPRATVMVYRLPSPPSPGETWRFSPLDGAAAGASYLSG